MTDNPSNKRIIVHAGAHKTGTSTIQATLYSNRKRLSANDIHFPGVNSNHWDLYAAFMTNPANWHENKKRGLDEAQAAERNRRSLEWFAEDLSSTQCSTIILSAEHLSMLEQEELEQLRDFLAQFGSVEAIYFCREVRSWLASDSQQCAKVGLKSELTHYQIGIRRFYDFPLKLARVFGAERFKLLRFEDTIQNGVTDSFLDCLGLPGCDALGIEEIFKNASISATAVRALFALNRATSDAQVPRSKKLVRILRGLPGPKLALPSLSFSEQRDYRRKVKIIAETFDIQPYDVPFFPRIWGSRDLPVDEETLQHLLVELNQNLTAS